MRVRPENAFVARKSVDVAIDHSSAGEEGVVELQSLRINDARDESDGGGVQAEGFFDAGSDIVYLVGCGGGRDKVAQGEDAVAPLRVMSEFD